MNPTRIDITTYLQVIGVASEQLIHGADPDSLKLLYSHHVRSLPFSTVSLVCGYPVDPDLDAGVIADRMLVKRWGGVCFEHVALLGQVLQQLGFDVSYLGGEVWRDGWTPPNSHASLLVRFSDGTQFYCDVGFPLRPLEPLLLATGKEQLQSDGRCFLLESDAQDSNCWCLQQLEQSGDFELRHRFWLQPRTLSDFSKPAQALSDPNHRFMNGWLMAICRTDGALVTLAAGHWAGSDVAEDKAKYVSRRERVRGNNSSSSMNRGDGSNGDRGEAQLSSSASASQQHQQCVRHTTLIPRASSMLRSLVEREFRIQTEQLRGSCVGAGEGAGDFFGSVEESDP